MVGLGLLQVVEARIKRVASVGRGASEACMLVKAPSLFSWLSRVMLLSSNSNVTTSPSVLIFASAALGTHEKPRYLMVSFVT